MATASQHLIEMSLKGRTLRSVVFSGRRSGRSWQSIADEVQELTSIPVSRQTLVNWFPDAPRPEEAKAESAAS